MLRKAAGILTASVICIASAVQAHPVHYAMAVVDVRSNLLPSPDNVYSAVANEAGKARADALEKCRKAWERDCIVIGSGTISHPHWH